MGSHVSTAVSSCHAWQGLLQHWQLLPSHVVGATLSKRFCHSPISSWQGLLQEGSSSSRWLCLVIIELEVILHQSHGLLEEHIGRTSLRQQSMHSWHSKPSGVTAPCIHTFGWGGGKSRPVPHHCTTSSVVSARKALNAAPELFSPHNALLTSMFFPVTGPNSGLAMTHSLFARICRDSTLQNQSMTELLRRKFHAVDGSTTTATGQSLDLGGWSCCCPRKALRSARSFQIHALFHFEG
jgi:hypothetical protein